MRWLLGVTFLVRTSPASVLACLITVCFSGQSLLLSCHFRWSLFFCADFGACLTKHYNWESLLLLLCIYFTQVVHTEDAKKLGVVKNKNLTMVRSRSVLTEKITVLISSLLRLLPLMVKCYLEAKLVQLTNVLHAT
jgi:hypothetical protein